MPDDDVMPETAPTPEVLDTTGSEPSGALTKPEWDAIADAHPAVVEFVRATGKRRRLGVRTQALRKIAEAAGAGKVAVATVHAAKGREWDAVVLLTSRDWPGPRPRPEELRVAFVAATRARRHLVILEG